MPHFAHITVQHCLHILVPAVACSSSLVLQSLQAVARSSDCNFARVKALAGVPVCKQQCQMSASEEVFACSNVNLLFLIFCTGKQTPAAILNPHEGSSSCMLQFFGPCKLLQGGKSGCINNLLAYGKICRGKTPCVEFGGSFC